MAIWVYGYLEIWVCTEDPDFDLNGCVESVNSIVKLELILQLFNYSIYQQNNVNIL